MKKNYIQPRKKIAIITGASSGLGWEFSREIDNEKEIEEVWLIARRKKNLDTLSKKLKNKPVVLTLDLQNPNSISQLQKKLEKENPIIRFLVNNAGIGAVGFAKEISSERQIGMVDLNVKALTKITLLSIPYMQEGSSIIQIASSAGFAPMANFAIYAASKAFVIYFSEGLRAELKEEKIHVCTVCPGPVKTEFFEGASGNKPPRLAADPVEVVRLAMKDTKKGKAFSIYGFPMKLYYTLVNFLPKSLILWFTKKVKFA
ncbi:MAG: SDR family NAD(P)-dependent oxidoreductase [Leptospiraceae bacterium]|nr:SDR family NAD(P)-dependent oxidoreductase [Leptospiraceae bacterium]MCK6380520.1 SDR family NAD(P)-dependent oxidoreductase [Leptospiraceae bacterium]NUM41052.1 SDR family NAD(P)-dependent oxidoreductase [Leptospiraceae bacterium]